MPNSSRVFQSQGSLNDLSSTIKNVSKSTQLDGISSGVETIAPKFYQSKRYRCNSSCQPDERSDQFRQEYDR